MKLSSSILAADSGLIRRAWDRLRAVPGGKQAFSALLGTLIPYTGSIRGSFRDLTTGYARVSMRDRRAIRNHLASIHAAALVNLAELAGNAAVVYSMPADARFIVKGLTIDYLKKAHGTITATAHVALPITSERKEHEVTVELHDRAGDLVARVKMRTLVGPRAIAN